MSHNTQDPKRRLRGKRLAKKTKGNKTVNLKAFRFNDPHKRNYTRYARVNKTWLFAQSAAIRCSMYSHPVKTLADMTPEERSAIEARLGAKIL